MTAFDSPVIDGNIRSCTDGIFMWSPCDFGRFDWPYLKDPEDNLPKYYSYLSTKKTELYRLMPK